MFKNFIKDFGKFLVVPFQYPDCIFLGFDNFFLFLALCFQRGDKPITAGKPLLVTWLPILTPLSAQIICLQFLRNRMDKTHKKGANHSLQI